MRGRVKAEIQKHYRIANGYVAKGRAPCETEGKLLLTTRCRKELTGVRGGWFFPRPSLHIYIDIVMSCRGRATHGSHYT